VVASFGLAILVGQAWSLVWIVTESGAPHVATAGNPGGDDYARNYILKLMTAAQSEGISRVDWFILTDGTDTSTDPFQSMGLYLNIQGLSSIDAATKTETGWAYTTLGKNLATARFDATETTALALPSGVLGAAYRVTADPNGKRAFVLWARAADGTETGSSTLTLPVTGSVHEFDWDSAMNGDASTQIAATGGAVTVPLDGTPRIFLED
jgi:hypothetical protein